MTSVTNRKTQIILAAIECISRYGYSNFSMQDLAELADVSKGVIHYYFLNKEALMMAVLEHVCKESENLVEGNEHILNPIERLTHVLWICANIQRTKREHYKIIMEFWTQVDQKDHVRKVISEHYENFRFVFKQILEDGMKQKIFKTVNSNNFATLMIAMIDGISLQLHFNESLSKFDKLIKDCEQSIIILLTQTSGED